MMSRARGQAESEILISNKAMLVGQRNAVCALRSMVMISTTIF